MSPDPLDVDVELSAIHNHVENLGPWLAIWQARTEPDAHARRCASDAIGALDELVAAAWRIRERLVGEVRRADDAAAIRVDALLARTRDGPREIPEGRQSPDLTARLGADVMPHQATPDRRHCGGPREAAP